MFGTAYFAGGTAYFAWGTAYFAYVTAKYAVPLNKLLFFLLPLWYTQANIKITNLGKEKRS